MERQSCFPRQFKGQMHGRPLSPAFLRDPLHPAVLHLGSAPAHSRSKVEEKRWSPEALARSRLAHEQSLSLGALPCLLPPAPAPCTPPATGIPGIGTALGVHSILLIPPCIPVPNPSGTAPSIPELQLCCFPSCSTKDVLKSESKENDAACGKF